jgi:hypothetical protein
MKLVLSLRTRDHGDLVDAHVAFHLAAGVDTIVATDHRSADGTREILERYEREGSLVLVRNDAEEYTPGMLLNEAVRIAATELGADWIIHADADEFWWPRGGDLKDVLATVPARFGVVRGFWRHFAPRPEDGSHFAERMVVRLAARSPWRGVEHTFHPHVKIAQRADPSIVVRRGSHDVVTSSRIFRAWYPFELLHFPLRTARQAFAKYDAWRPVLDRGFSVASHVDSAVDAIRADAFDDFYRQYVVDDERLAAGLAEGWLAVDTRFRDALRALAGSPHEPLGDRTEFSPRHVRLDFPPFDLAAQAAHADDAMALADPVERVRARIDGFEERLDALR